MTTDKGQTETLFKWMLVVASAIADLVTVAAFLASAVKQDGLLILFVIVAAAAFIGAIYRVRRFLSRTGRVRVLLASIGSLVLAAVAWSLLASSGVAPIEVNISEPQNGASVTRQYLVKGTVSDSNARVFVIVHPLAVSEMWVQQRPIVDGKGNWQALANFGMEIIRPDGEQYEVIALATNDNFLVTWATGNSLSEGQKLRSLPRKSNRSNLITVTRTK